LLRFVAEAFNRSQDLVGRFGPFEGPGILVVPIDKRTDIGFLPVARHDRGETKG
jgi:hypothetical protein